MLIEWFQVHLIVLIIELRMVVTFYAHNLISFKNYVFLVSVFGATPNHIPFTYHHM